jgi:DNA-binding response OmpR family regulator
MEDVLVVDDDRMMLEVIKRILAYGGIMAHCVSNGAAALEKMKERNFQLMITDFNMPGLDGIELTRKSLEIAPNMRVIMDTSGLSAKNVRLALDTGVSKIVTKPFLPDEMLETVRGLIDSRVALCI